MVLLHSLLMFALCVGLTLACCPTVPVDRPPPAEASATLSGPLLSCLVGGAR
jgi:hypothetical protein